MLAALFLAAVPSSAQAATFTVNSTDDAPDAGTFDPACATAAPVRCTLRAAIQQANSDPASADEIILPAGNYALTLAAGDDTAATGDLDITGSVVIQGASAASTIVRQTVVDRVFDIQQNQQAAAPIELASIGVTGGQLGGIRSPSTFTRLEITDSAISGNTNSGPGGGIVADNVASGVPATISGTTISGNSAPSAGGIWVDDGAVITLENSTISGNTATGAGGGGGILTDPVNGSPEGTATLTNSTVTANVAPNGTGGAFNNDGTINVRNTIVSGNSGGNCVAGEGPTSQGNNVENGTSCGLSGLGDINADPLLGPLADNGGGTQTHAIAANSPAVNAAGSCPPPTDQRGVSRPQGVACDIGAYEFVFSKTVPSIPDCSPTGAITLAMDPPAGETPVAFKYKVDDGPTQTAPTDDETETINFPEGSFKLEYWSQTSAGEEPQANHLVGTALVDMTDPTISVASDQGQALYVIKRNASVTVQAGDALSGLTVDPSAQSEPVGTDSRGQKMVEWTAQDLCENQATQRFEYTVLGPGLGERAVIEPLGEDVEVRVPAAAGARASQAGTDFEPLSQPREIPIGSTIDARGGEARITSSKSTTEGDIQDGAFVAGLFQVLQSRKASAQGLTTLELKGSNFRNCQADAGTARLSRRARRRLRGNATGRFRTRGRHSAATVRGTKWTVTDRCDGTLTKVERGEVAVRDFRLKKTITLTDGKRYLARAEPPPPALGKTMNVSPVKGKVFVKLPRGGKFARASQKGASFVPLTEARSIPVRSILDTRKGTVALRTARNRKGKVQSGRFAAGIFQVLQSRKRREKGVAELRLKGSAAKFKRCGGKGSAAGGEPVADASLSRRAIRRLRARARGRYRTRGRHSAATVRGTVWNMTDSCAGTLTTVKRGKVAVRDFRLKKTILVRAGKSYLARPR